VLAIEEQNQVTDQPADGGRELGVLAKVPIKLPEALWLQRPRLQFRVVLDHG